MKKIYYLKTCDTSKRILKTLPAKGFVLQEIKTEPITFKQLEEMRSLSGSYESLFSRRAKKYKTMDLKNQTMIEQDYKQLIIDEYTFLKRPVVIIENQIFIGSSKKNIKLLHQKIIDSKLK